MACTRRSPENTRARALYRSVGFFEEGRRLAEFPTAPGRYSDDIQMFRQTAQRFIETEFLPRQDCWRGQRGPDPGAWTSAGATGILLPDIPEE